MHANKSARKHGGRRIDAGRPEGTGRYGEPTITVRVPESLELKVKAYIEWRKNRALPLRCR
jgi:DNA polymerase V